MDALAADAPVRIAQICRIGTAAPTAIGYPV
jgi:hypothetical protein